MTPKLTLNMIRHTLPLGLALASMLPTYAATFDKEERAVATQSEYRFKLPDSPDGLARFSTVAYPYAGANVYTIRGKNIAVAGDRIIDLDINPAGFNYIVVTVNKKGRTNAKVYGTDRPNHRLYKHNTKKLGSPTAACYTPDALNILLATADSVLRTIDSRSFKMVDEMPLEHRVTDMTLSSNRYHLATTDGANVTVYNFEDKSVRHKWDFEGGVKEILFSDDDTEFAVLTDDGMLSIYDTRTFMIKNTVEDLGDGMSASYNFDSKYIAVAKSPTDIVIVNLLDPEEDREIVSVPDGKLKDVLFLPDSRKNTLLAYTTHKAMDVKRMYHLTPYYTKLIDDEVNRKMNEWLKMMPGETLEEYQLRVNDETRAAHRRLLEDEAATRLAPDMVAMAEITLGQYDERHGLLEVDFNNMPAIYLPVPQSDITAFTNPEDLTFTNAKYTVTSGDKFELIYAEVLNAADGKTYIYDNVDRVPLNFMQDDEEEDIVSLELIQQQQMEELKLREIQEQVVEEAKSQNVISDHTNITVATEVEPDYDANGNKILNYKVRFTYEVDPGFTAQEDFGPGKYRIEQSGAAKSMLELVKKSLDGELARYIAAGKKLNVRISGTADSSPIVGRIIYDGIYGEFIDEPVYNNGDMTGITVTPKGRITQNEQLAFLRAQGVKGFLQENIKELQDMRTSYRIDINVAEGKGSQFRRITTELTFVDAF
ncbi:MAG: WD40 repeat domain-containing protein [Muribaculaceae bacterium]|nr:WD40 repeat domain-containing protein [Muribaculaceae bacterium]